jgi:obg-like ATPase 1
VYQKLEQILVQEDADVRLRPWTRAEAQVINSLQLLTAKPMVYLVNLSEKDAVTGQGKKFQIIKEWVAANRPNDVVIGYSGMLENELSVLETPEEKEEYLEEVNRKYGVVDKDKMYKSAMSDMIWAGYKAMRLEHFFTAGPEEVRAWTLKRDTKAPQAAAVIHSDFEKSFVAAEVMRLVYGPFIIAVCL